MPEMKAALKKLQEESKKGAVQHAEMLVRIERYHQRNEAAKVAADVTRQFERIKRDLDLVRSGKLPMRDRVGMKLADKSSSLNVNEVVARWDESGDGNIGKSEFRIHVARLLGLESGPEAAVGGEIDDVFDSLDKVR